MSLAALSWAFSLNLPPTRRSCSSHWRIVRTMRPACCCSDGAAARAGGSDGTVSMVKGTGRKKR